ncbi:hypothetical protein A2U01_0077104, partial [Trifolium medium]|nr:hypothetical protein [Trifolium medium]
VLQSIGLIVSPELPRTPQQVVSETMVRRRVQPAPCIESLPDKGGHAAGPVEHNNDGTSTSVWMKKASA